MEIEKAIENIRKQNKMIGIDYSNGKDLTAYSCPACGGGFTGTGIADYCYHCGQKLDWGDEQ